ncbi:MAG TPA: hypothetical protein VF157_13125, partial [Chloroflexota bacterium]
RAAGLVAAFVVAANPAFIFYAKEARDNGLMAFTGALSFVLLLLALRRPALLPAYVVAALAALFSHYYDVAIVGLEMVVGLVWLARHRKLRVWPWVAAPAALVLGYLPWLLYARSTIANYDVGRGSPGVFWSALLQTFQAFNFGFAVRPPDLFWPSLVALALVVLGVAGALAIRKGLLWLAAAYALAPVAFGAVSLLHQTNFNPRYLFAGAPGYALILGSGLVLLWRWHWTACALACLFLLACTGYTIRNTDFDAAFQPNGYRQMAAYLARHGGPNDSMVLDGVSQWPLYFYYGQLQEHLPQRVEFLPLETRPGTERTVQELLAGNVWYLESDLDRYDPTHDVERLLATYGFQAYDIHFDGQRLEYFAGPAAGPPVPVDARFGGLHLIAAAGAGRQVSAGSVIGVGLDWRREGGPVPPFKSSLRLEDEGGTIVAQNDTLPQAGHVDFSGWAQGQIVSTRPGLLVPIGTPPGAYRLRLLTYGAESGAPLGPAVDLGSITVDHAAPQNPAAAELPAVGSSLGPLRLESASVPANGIRPGDRVPITLLWSGARTPLPVRVTVAVGDRRQDHQAGGDAYPSTSWLPGGDVVRDVASFRVPAAAPAGTYPVTIDGVPIGSLRVLPVARSFSPPPLAHQVEARFGEVAKLLGYELQPGAGGTHLLLAWQALAETETSYTVFVHGLDSDGRVVTQADVPPGTDHWVKDQVVTTEYDLSGPIPARLEVGLYDQPTGKRLPACCPAADSVTLPT